MLDKTGAMEQNCRKDGPEPVNEEKENSLLIIDDEKVNLKILTHILGPEYTIYTATSGESGINIAMECLPDLILMDILMPKMDGYQALSEIKKSEKTRNIPVIFITGLTSEKDEEKGLALDAADYITKPFSAMVVRLRVRNQIQIINLRRDLEYAVKNAKMANQTKSLFLAHMSHEIRTPMNSILGVTEILMQQETLPVKIEEGLGKIYSSCNLLLGIINDILDFSKIEAGKLEIAPAQYKVASMINDSLQLNMMRLESKPIKFELHLDENIPANLIGDELRIKQIMNNLLSNAFKYTDAGKVALSIKTEASDRLLNDHVTLVLSVRDTGYGMSQDQLAKLFEEYARFHSKTSRTIEGTGLGLSIVKRLINIMGGEIYVKSELGVGSYFVVRLPQGKVNDEVISKDVAERLRQSGMNYTAQGKREQIMRDPMPYGSVLIVDDVESNIYVAVGLMKLYRLQIDTAMSGQETLDKIKAGKVYDAIFLDHMMPKMDGMETARHIRALGYTAPIVALTANAVVGQAEMFLQNGFDEFISKPIDTRQLDFILNKRIRDKQPPEVIEAARRQKANAAGANNGMPAEIDALLFQSFIKDAAKAIGWLEEKFQNEGLKHKEGFREFTIIVHGIKSSLWSIGEQELSKLALKLETAGREISTGPQSGILEAQDIESILTGTREFLEKLRILLRTLEAKQEKDFPEHDSQDDDTEDLHEKLIAIQEMCSSYNRKGALDSISGIRKCSAKTKAVLDKVMEYVLHSDFEEAENEVAVYAQTVLIQDMPSASSPSPLTSFLLKKNINGLDIAKGLERYEGDEQTYLKVLRSYVVSVRSMLEEIEEAKEDALADYKIKVHGIKGTSFDFFAEETGKKALALEKAALAGDFNYIQEHHPAFLETAWELISELEEMLAYLDAENPKPKKDKPDREILLKLLAACEAYDIDEADAAMAEIEKYQYESDDGLADWLKENLDRMDFKQIVERLGGKDL